MLTIGICLEDIKEASWLEEAILNLQRAKTEVYLSGQELLRELENGEQFDLLWLSVTLTDMSGVELGRVLREEREDERTFLVYSSNHLEDALQLFRVRPLDFVMDLRQTQRIDQILATANRLRKRHPRFFEYQKGQEVKKLPMQEILYFQSENRQVHIITKRQEDVFYGTLSQVEKQLDQEEFLWIHKSILVNQQHISKYQYDQITLENGVILPISQAKRKEIRRMRLEKEQWEN